MRAAVTLLVQRGIARGLGQRQRNTVPALVE